MMSRNEQEQSAFLAGPVPSHATWVSGIFSSGSLPRYPQRQGPTSGDNADFLQEGCQIVSAPCEGIM